MSRTHLGGQRGGGHEPGLQQCVLQPGRRRRLLPRAQRRSRHARCQAAAQHRLPVTLVPAAGPETESDPASSMSASADGASASGVDVVNGFGRCVSMYVMQHMYRARCSDGRRCGIDRQRADPLHKNTGLSECKAASCRHSSGVAHAVKRAPGSRPASSHA